jgi:hypothetical protein
MAGWTTEAYQHETTLSEHLIQTHTCMVNSAEVSRLYDRNAQASVAAAADRMAASAFLHNNPVSAPNCLFGLLAAPPLFFIITLLR